LLQARKPYTITKQRERWTEEEHAKFVEALKKHGRQWRKIEGEAGNPMRQLQPMGVGHERADQRCGFFAEHVGTKTAVQIRSHAQKFFTKIEKKKETGEPAQQGKCCWWDPCA
jgi:hypothetical protein